MTTHVYHDSPKRVVIVTGGAGFIGSHIAVELLQDGRYEVVIVDSLVNSDAKVLDRIENITKRKVHGFHKTDICDTPALEKVFEIYSGRIHSVLHLAGLKAVGESGRYPLLYYHVNITGTLSLLQVMKKYSVRNIVYSSSATVYGNVQDVPEGGLIESQTSEATNTYGRTKLMNEDILRDIQKAEPDWNVALLRYFNPIGAHESGKIGENPTGVPQNLMPYLTQVLVGKRAHLEVFGNDYPTVDGTAIRDYLHVVDLALGHLAALDNLDKNPGFVVYNLGTGIGYSVLEVLNAMKIASGKDIPYKFAPRRPGDVPKLVACPNKAKEALGWTAKRELLKMCEDSWRWQQQNPNGYSETPKCN